MQKFAQVVMLCLVAVGTSAACPNKPGIPIKGCPETPMPAGVVAADKLWLRCLFSSMNIQMTKFVDKNEAAEAAFLACRAEEDGLRAALVAESHLTSEEASTAISYFKPRAKEALVAAGGD
jgi:hypothetical protein